MDPVEITVASIRRHAMLNGGETVLIGLSGGPDSVCLTVVLHRLSSRLNLKLHALYIDHGLRPKETPREIEFCKALCGKMGIPLLVEHVDAGAYAKQKVMNLQEAARELRYQIYEAAARRVKAHKVAVGHNLDDQAETFVMRMLRGAGRGGLVGIPAVRDSVIRPLMDVERREIEEFLRKEGISFVIDSSNLKADYLRNRLRTDLMPLLREINPSILQGLSRTSEIFEDEERHFQLAVTRALMKLITRKTDLAIELFLAPLENLDRAVLRRVLRRAIEETRGLRGMQFIHVEDIMRLIREGSPGDRIYLPKCLRAIKKYSTLLITAEPPTRLGTRVIEAEGEAVLREAGLLIRASLTTAPPEDHGRDIEVFDADKARFPLTIRAREKGDFFHPMGFGKKKKLQDYFVDEKIPRDERDSLAVVTSGGAIVWIAGMRGDERFGPDEHTGRFLVLEARRLRENARL